MSVLSPDDSRHGRPSTYTNYGCRCDLCREAWRSYHRAYRHRSGRNLPAEKWRAQVAAEAAMRHGTEGTYRRCKCAKCTAAASAARRRRRRRQNSATNRTVLVIDWAPHVSVSDMDRLAEAWSNAIREKQTVADVVFLTFNPAILLRDPGDETDAA